MNWKAISLLFEMLIGLKFIDKINSVYLKFFIHITKQ